MTELEALQNAVKSTGTQGLEIFEYQNEDKRKTIQKYYLCLDGATISPRLDYEQMNHFILGFSRAKQLTGHEQQKAYNEMLSSLKCVDQVLEILIGTPQYVQPENLRIYKALYESNTGIMIRNAIQQGEQAILKPTEAR